jgi:hypothetical protein
MQFIWLNKPSLRGGRPLRAAASASAHASAPGERGRPEWGREKCRRPAPGGRQTDTQTDRHSDYRQTDRRDRVWSVNRDVSGRAARQGAVRAVGRVCGALYPLRLYALK